jgi:ATP-binding cassette subfamily A (ABC1) protein 3
VLAEEDRVKNQKITNGKKVAPDDPE